MKYFTLLIANYICIVIASNLQCNTMQTFQTPGDQFLAYQMQNGFCNDYIIGSNLDHKKIFLQIKSNNIACSSGDNILIYDLNKTNVILDYCKAIESGGISNFVFVDEKFIVLTLTTLSSLSRFMFFTFVLLDSTPSTPTVPMTTTTTTTTLPSVFACGRPYFKPIEQLRIIGGIEAAPNSWPWQVYLTDGKLLCGATLIDNNWIVTAAHCLEGANQQNLTGKFGVHNRFTNEQTTVLRSISKVIVHESYFGKSNLYENDIALLKLSRPVDYTNEILPVCLPEQDKNIAVVGSTAYATGWGLTSAYGSTSDVLRQVSINILSPGYCIAGSPNFICAGGFSPVRDSCRGDSGGPLVTKLNNIYYLSGIVSWGSHDCGGEGIYTKLSNYVDWIHNNMKKF